MERKINCIRALEKAAQYEKQLARYNMETMILKGIRNPCVNRDEMEKTIAVIDRISIAVFDRSDSLLDKF